MHTHPCDRRFSPSSSLLQPMGLLTWWAVCKTCSINVLMVWMAVLPAYMIGSLWLSFSDTDSMCWLMVTFCGMWKGSFKVLSVIRQAVFFSRGLSLYLPVTAWWLLQAVVSKWSTVIGFCFSWSRRWFYQAKNSSCWMYWFTLRLTQYRPSLLWNAWISYLLYNCKVQITVLWTTMKFGSLQNRPFTKRSLSLLTSSSFELFLS